MLIHRLLKQCLAVAPLALVTACGGSDVSTDNTTASGSGYLSLAITDGPIDSASKVVVEFTGVSIKPVDGDVIEFTFDEAVSIDLLMLQGQVSQYILADESIPAGAYEWVRLAVNAELDDTMDSFVEFDDGTQLELWIPSGAETGLKLVSGFTVPEDGGADFTVDFDLRKSIVVPGDGANALLTPALRIVDTFSAGSIEGEVDAAFIAAGCENAEVNSGAVYAFPGDAVPSDVRGDDSDPIASALVKYDAGAYRYELGFVPEGDYTIAYTCDAVNDDPETEDKLAFVDLSGGRVIVKVGENVIVDFVPGEGAPDVDQGNNGEKPETPEVPEVEAPEAPEVEEPEVEEPEVDESDVDEEADDSVEVDDTII